MIKWSFCLLSLISWCGLFAETRPEILDRIRDYDLRHSDLLVKIIKDGETLRYAKVRALEKISTIYQQSKEQGELVATRYLEGLKAGLAHKSPDVREAACNASGVFKDSSIAQPLAVAMAKSLTDETQPAVTYACAHSASVFAKSADVIVPALLAKVQRYLVDYYSSSDDEKAITEVCHALGVMKARKSFIPLLKILQSHYDDDVKSAAQEAIQAIRIH